MKAAKLEVAAGKKLEISNDEPRGGQRVYLRPKTLVALKTLAGAPVLRPARLTDKSAFDMIEDEKTLGQLKPLVPDKTGKIGGSPHKLVRALISSLPQREQIPKTVTAIQRTRALNQARAARSLYELPIPMPDPPDASLFREAWWMSRIRKIVELEVPAWLQGLEVYSPSVMYDEIVVQADGTLLVLASITNLSTGNFYMHRGARVVQASPYLTVEVTGELQGDLP